ncbi:helix-turn-helix domain-containing protein [Aquimarina macrocephali]|uniref:helix-turn-helix domain-containing protein n=1 Tax=Aquimarina macrocephali TaxID=666563 RepID=UPI0004657EA1|nr:helix-turn-helix domain-containing protein [Aquimarina macrocephali]
MKRAQLIDLTPEQLIEIFDSTIAKRLDVLKKELLHENANDEILTREEVCKILSIDPSTLWHWQKKNKIRVYGISGSRRYYKRSEIIAALKLLKS